jgi:K+-sensing histidine kinase KdpD
VRNQRFWRSLSPYLIAFGAVSCAVIGTSQLGPALNHSCIILFFSVILTSWYGGLFPGLFAASLSCLALDYFFIPPIHSLAMNAAEVPGIAVFGTAACLFSWLNSGRRWIGEPLRKGGRSESVLAVIAVKLALALVLSLACCLAAQVAMLVGSGSSWEYLWLNIGAASGCSAFFLIISAVRDF